MKSFNSISSVARQRGFTLIELVVVVLILGIVAAVASPSMFDAAGDARDNAAHSSLSILRETIQLHRAQIGAFPGDAGTEADLKADLDPYISGPFPTIEVGNSGNTVRIQQTGAPLTVSGTESWAYDNVSGEIIINHASYSAL